MVLIPTKDERNQAERERAETAEKRADVAEKLRTQVDGCDDTAQLMMWLQQAAASSPAATSAEELVKQT